MAYEGPSKGGACRRREYPHTKTAGGFGAVAPIGGGASGAVAHVEWDFAQVEFSLPLDKMGQSNIIMRSKSIIS